MVSKIFAEPERGRIRLLLFASGFGYFDLHDNSSVLSLVAVSRHMVLTATLILA